MISIDEARVRILEQSALTPPVRLPIDQCVGLVLAEPAVSDIDSPPYDKAMVDGYALRSIDVTTPGVELDVVELIAAGDMPRHTLRRGMATQIMTGTPVPPGADAVVMVEETQRIGADTPASGLTGRVRIDTQRVRAGQHIMRQGSSVRNGTRVLSAGHIVRPVDVGLLCEIGCALLGVRRPPRVAVLSTGSELVPAQCRPAAGAIRNSNGPMLCALVHALRAQVTDLGISPDQPEALTSAMEQGFSHDVLILSGGVSAGLLDLVPDLLRRLGTQEVFHHVHLKPGKPLWFGVRQSAAQKTLVFGLPGNPVSSLVCFELFVAPALRQMLGRADAVSQLETARLDQPYVRRGDRPTYLPARVTYSATAGFLVTLVPWEGSADQRALSEANCLAVFPPGDCTYAAGERIAIHRFAWHEPVSSLIPP